MFILIVSLRSLWAGLASSPKASPSPPASSGRGSNKVDVNNRNAGRKKRDWNQEISQLTVAFANSKETDPLWWGAEASTMLKEMRTKEKQLKDAIRNETLLEHSRKLSLLNKEVAMVIAIVDVVSSHGNASDDFRRIYDMQESLAKMEPVVSFTFPAHLRSARHAQLCAGIEQSDQWISRVTTSDLVSAGVTNPGLEQEKMFSERLTGILRNSDSSKRQLLLRDTLMLDYEYDLKDDVMGFVNAIAVLVAYEDFDSLDSRADLLEDSLKELESHIPDPKKKFPGSLLGSALVCSHAGVALLKDAKLALSTAKLTLTGIKQQKVKEQTATTNK